MKKLEEKKAESSHRSFGLDLIRAIAIVFVLIAHFAKILEPFGFWGVELFFALSGFLIGHILWRSFNSEAKWNYAKVRNFWYRRWWRTLPNYYLFLIISLFFHYFIENNSPDISTFFYFTWFGQNLLSPNGAFFGVSWSLCIEEWLYLLFPLIMVLFSNFIKSKKLAYAYSLLFLFINSILLREYLVIIDPHIALRGVTLARLDAIGYGIGIAYMTACFNLTLTVKKTLFVLGSLMLLIPIYLLLIEHMPYDILKHHKALLIIMPIGSSLLLPWISNMQPFPKCIGWINVSIEKLSLWTYSIYLSHIPILITTYYLLEDIRSSNFGNFLSKILGLLLTLVISSLIFKHFELPLMKHRPKEL